MDRGTSIEQITAPASCVLHTATEAPSGTFVAFPGNASPCSSILKWVSLINSSLGENQRKHQL